LFLEKPLESDSVMAKKPFSLTVVGSNANVLEPPRKLGKHGLSLWASVQHEYMITDVGGIELLAQACGGLDRLEAISAQINADGEMIQTRTGVRSHPLIKEEIALRALICRTLERLGITLEAIKPPGRPPGPGPTF
jgi:hypothetical protein